MVLSGIVTFLSGDRLLSFGEKLYRLNRGGLFGSDHVCYLLLYRLVYSGGQKNVSFPGQVLTESEVIFLGSQNRRPQELRYREPPAGRLSLVGRAWKNALLGAAKFTLDIF